ncbi:MAG: hypothetical protein HC871_08370 [Rhizobiales bacterium]|nr:hypothetical protein [Hyphomicrobiales bacterium]
MTALYGLRVINALLSTWAVGLLFVLARCVGWHRPATLLFAVLIVATPTLSIIGGIVSNDNLAFLGGTMCSFGVFRALGDSHRRSAWGWIAGGLVLAGLAKFTAALLCWLLVGMACLYLLSRSGRALLQNFWAVAALTIGLLALAPYIVLWLQYGSPTPFTEAQETIIARRMLEMTGGQNEPFGSVRYLLHFLQSLLMFWPPTLPRTTGDVI